MMVEPYIDRSTYAYVGQLSRAGIAWEFLRRNADYQRDWQIHRTILPRRNVTRDGIEFYSLQRPFIQAEYWGLRAFENPETDARNASLFWLFDALGRSVEAKVATENNERTITANWLSISDIAGVRAILVDSAGVVHIAIDSDYSSIGLSIWNMRQLFGRFVLVFQIPAFENVRRRIEAILSLEWRVIRRLPKSVLSDKVDAHFRSKLSHCLIAVDARRVGLSYRDLARVLLGAELVASDWGGASRFLKERMRRLVDKGENLVDGGYRSLLR